MYYKVIIWSGYAEKVAWTLTGDSTDSIDSWWYTLVGLPWLSCVLFSWSASSSGLALERATKERVKVCVYMRGWPISWAQHSLQCIWQKTTSVRSQLFHMLVEWSLSCDTHTFLYGIVAHSNWHNHLFKSTTQVLPQKNNINNYITVNHLAQMHAVTNNPLITKFGKRCSWWSYGVIIFGHLNPYPIIWYIARTCNGPDHRLGWWRQWPRSLSDHPLAYHVTMCKKNYVTFMTWHSSVQHHIDVFTKRPRQDVTLVLVVHE